MQNFPQQLQTPISQKQKIFSGLFIEYLECASNLQHFEKKDEHPSLVISEIIYSERDTVQISTTPLLSYFSMNSR